MNKPEIYLGDGAYLTGDGRHLILSTGSHSPDEWDSVIFLDDDVSRKLYEYLHNMYNGKT